MRKYLSLFLYKVLALRKDYCLKSSRHRNEWAVLNVRSAGFIGVLKSSEVAVSVKIINKVE